MLLYIVQEASFFCATIFGRNIRFTDKNYNFNMIIELDIIAFLNYSLCVKLELYWKGMSYVGKSKSARSDRERSSIG